MAQYKYIALQVPADSSVGIDNYSLTDKKIVSNFSINSVFDPKKNYIEHHIYSIDGELLESNHNYNQQSFLQSSGIANNEKASEISLNPEEDAKYSGYTYGGVKFVYNFLNDVYSDTEKTVDFFIEEISSDRTEIRILTTKLSDKEVVEKTLSIKEKLNSSSYVYDLRLNLKRNQLLISTNIETLPYKDTQSVVLKLYKPLPDGVEVKSVINLNEIISDTVAFEIESEVIVDEIKIPSLAGPNFSTDPSSDNHPSEYFSYNDLFSYSLTSSYREITSLFNEKGAEISIDYSDHENFINFSSAQERLLNFKYKLDLVETYQSSIDLIEAASGTDSGISGSRDYYRELIDGVVGNFDHYDRYLYFESSSKAWPKTNSTKPFINATGALTGSWWTEAQTSASLYDSSNGNTLQNAIPSYLRDDPSNSKYNLFINLIAQHFDNLWIYSKAVTDKYDSDNRLNRGVSKDLVQAALKNFGVKLYTSNKSTQDLFKMFTGETYNTGSDTINNFQTATTEITSEDNYRKEVYKRLYHNLPILLKSKGTERGIRALLTSFGIPTDVYISGSLGTHAGLSPTFQGGIKTSGNVYLGNLDYYTSSIDKIRIDNTGSIVSGSTLSIDTSIVERDYKYTPDLHSTDIGYSPTTYIDNVIYNALTSSGFNIDEYIGDPGEYASSSYSNLEVQAQTILSANTQYDLQDFTRLLKFYDNVVFKMVKDFVPARTSISTGIIIKPHLLERNKIKQVTVDAHQKPTSGSVALLSQLTGDITLTGSIHIATTTGSHGETFGARANSSTIDTGSYYITAYTESIVVPDGVATYEYHNHEEPKFDGEFSGSYLKPSNGELNIDNDYKYDGSQPVTFTYTFIDGAIGCEVVFGFYSDCNIVITGTYPAGAAPTLEPTPSPTPSRTPIPGPTATPAPTAPATLAPSATPTSAPQAFTYYFIRECTDTARIQDGILGDLVIKTSQDISNWSHCLVPRYYGDTNGIFYIYSTATSTQYENGAGDYASVNVDQIAGFEQAYSQDCAGAGGGSQG